MPRWKLTFEDGTFFIATGHLEELAFKYRKGLVKAELVGES